MPESIPASLVIDTLKDTFREARKELAAEVAEPPQHSHLGWILSVPDTHQKTVLAALDKEEAIRTLTCATEDEATTIAAGWPTVSRKSRKATRQRSMIVSTTAAWKEAQTSATSAVVKGPARSTSSRTAVLRPEKEKSGFGRPSMGRGRSNRVALPSSANFSTRGPPG